MKNACPLFNTSLSFQQRISWLLDNLTPEEKTQWMGSRMPGCQRLGVPPFGLGGEAAHGVEGRNDQNGLGAPDVTTSFPQPIGMSASWDPALIRECGRITGTEARVVSHRHPGGRGLSRWAPTVDLERDPRWGRHEEGYGEDPVLTGAMAGAYIEGMQGDHETYIRCAATLKHFYGNNTEEGRAWKNDTIDPRNKYELYLEPFRRCIQQSGALGVMTAYNRINGTVGVLNSEVTTILKEQYGLTHAVGDGGALGLTVSGQHYYGNHAQAIAHAIKAGVDGMSDNPALVCKAAMAAYRQGLLTVADMDRAIAAKMMVAMRLGVFDGNANPYDQVTEADILTEEASALCLKMTEESLVLLKNDGLLPLTGKEETALIGPMAGVWYQDWYGGEPPCRSTLRDGLEALEVPHTFADGCDRVMLRFGSHGVRIGVDGSALLSSEPDVFVMEDWGDNDYTFRCLRTGTYLAMRLDGDAAPLGADLTAPFNWFVKEVFHLEQHGEETLLLDRFNWPVGVRGDRLYSGRAVAATAFTVDLVEDGVEKAVQLAAAADTVVLALGNSPMIPAKEERDRHTLALPKHQQRLMEAVFRANPRTALILLTNYPYAAGYASEHLPAILLSATGSQHMGLAIANALYGRTAPAGRLNTTWYASDDQLPSIDDYDIIRGKRTYRYFDRKPLYAFGHGLTYTSFAYDGLAVTETGGSLQVSFTVTNTGSTPSDEVAQVYAIAPESRVRKPLRQLVGFERLHNVQPGETRAVTLTIPTDELRFYDVISRGLMVEEGVYRFFAGPSSDVEATGADCFVPGQRTGLRDLDAFIPADHFDDCENIVLLEGTLGYTCVARHLDAPHGSVTYRDCAFDPDRANLSLRVMSRAGGSLTVLLDDEPIGRWEGDTRTCEHRSAPPLDRFAGEMIAARARERSPIWEDIDFLLPEGATRGALTFRITGDVQVSFFTATETPAQKKINTGIAN